MLSCQMLFSHVSWHRFLMMILLHNNPYLTCDLMSCRSVCLNMATAHTQRTVWSLALRLNSHKILQYCTFPQDCYCALEHNCRETIWKQSFICLIHCFGHANGVNGERERPSLHSLVDGNTRKYSKMFFHVKHRRRYFLSVLNAMYWQVVCFGQVNQTDSLMILSKRDVYSGLAQTNPCTHAIYHDTVLN